MQTKDLKIAIIGLGYVGLPLAVEFGKIRDVVGYDINKKRINELKSHIDKTLEIKTNDLKKAKKIFFTYKTSTLRECNCFIITVPTPINNANKPNLTPLFKATKTIGSILKRGDLVIYESTVYPGCTEDDCVPILEEKSGLKYNHDFFCGYSPERINPGDKKNNIVNIMKVTSGSTPKIAILIDRLYKQIIKAGTFKAKSIKIAEAAKVIENTQRDLNIALVNELSILFKKMQINTSEVLKTASTKWNFLNFQPGLVGGHCIGVDPYYLTYKAKKIGYNPKLILAGREINDRMSLYVVNKLLKQMKKQKIKVDSSKILVMGLTFKENCPDIRNTQVYKIVKSLKKFSQKVDVYDPWVSKDDARKQYGINLITNLNKKKYDAIVIAVKHKIFYKMGLNSIISLAKINYVLFDIKNVFNSNKITLNL